LPCFRELPLMVKVAQIYEDYQFIIGGHENFPESFYRSFTGSTDIRIIYGKTLDLLKIATAALVTSGTATLEAGLIGTPQVVCYNTAPVSFQIARLLIRTKYISLVNLILDRNCVTELIQNDYTLDNLSGSLEKILMDAAARKAITDGYEELDAMLGEQDASATAAAIIYHMAAGS